MRALLQMLRPANLPTAAADILAGFAIAFALSPDIVEPAAGATITDMDRYSEISRNLGLQAGQYLPQLLLTMLSSVFIYAGSVVLNDVFDRHVDRIERPERPIPAGRISTQRAAIAGSLLLVSGPALFALAASLLQRQPDFAIFYLATATALFAFCYNAICKRSSMTGPPVMGVTRGLNLMTGMAVAGLTTEAVLFALAPALYIAGVTLAARGEAGSNKPLSVRTGLVIAVSSATISQLTTGLVVWQLPGANIVATLFAGLIFFLLWALSVATAFFDALAHPDNENTRRAIVAGVMGLPLINGALAALVAGPVAGFVILIVAWVSRILSGRYSVS